MGSRSPDDEGASTENGSTLERHDTEPRGRPSGTNPVFSGSATVMVTNLGPVGGFVDGTASAPQLQAVQNGPTLSFQGSFHACRQPDAPDIGH